MKKIVSALIMLIMAISLATGCSQKAEPEKQPSEAKQETQAKLEKKFKIGIVQIVEHPSLNEIKDSITSNLEQMGLKNKVEIIYKNAQGDPSNGNTIASYFIGEKVDVIVPIATPVAQSAAAATKNIPIVFAAVSYPVDAGLVKDVNKPEANVTGVSDALDVTEIFSLAKKLTPQAKTFGFLYNAGEVNSVTAIENAKKYCDSNNLKYVEATITNSSELLQAAQSLLAKSDAIFTPTDNTVASAMPVLAQEANKAKKPVYVGADSMVKDGGFATVGVDYKQLGKQVAVMIKKIVDGEKINNIPVETLTKYSTIVNSKVAKEIGITIPQDIQNSAILVE